VVLVEGTSDRHAVETLARRRGRDLEAEGIAIVPMGGATNIRRFLDVYGPRGFDTRLAGLYDAGEEDDFKRALEREGFGRDLTRADLEQLGFYACQADLEEELIRALGTAAVEGVIEAQDELASLRSLQNQPAWRGRNVEEQLRRFFGSKGSRKSRFGALLVEAMDLSQVPRPLDRVLAHL
ncbi:MAG TPA: TOPRIM nucleotidyl transferase/hydrolase domain-containing protein, partial [Candidatus Dormibacteraeota bacterium]